MSLLAFIPPPMSLLTFIPLLEEAKFGRFVQHCADNLSNREFRQAASTKANPPVTACDVTA